MKTIRIFLLLYLYVVNSLYATEPIPLDLTLSHHEVGSVSWVYEDTSAKMRLEDIIQLPMGKFTPLGTPVSSNQFTNSAFWYQFDVENTTSANLSRLIVFETAWLNDIRFTVISPSGEVTSYQGGTNHPFSMRANKHHLINFKHTFKQGKSKVFIRVATQDPFIFTASIMEESKYFFDYSMKSIFIGFIFGGIMTILVYLLFLYIATKKRYYILYVITLFTFLLMNASYNEYTFMYLFPNEPSLQSWLRSGSIYIFILAYIIFARDFLELGKYGDKLIITGRYLIYLITLLLLIVPFIGGYKYHIIFALVSIFAGAFYIFIIAVYTLYKGNRSARFFIFGTLSGIVGAIITVFSVLDYLPYNYINYKASDFAMYLDVLLLSLAIADRMKMIHREKDIAEHNANTDSLTGLLNLRSYFDISRSEYKRITRSSIPFAVVMIDIDKFKDVNDTYGHSAGDKALKLIADILLDSIREYDYAFRRGGDEFLVFLPETTQDMAHSLAQRIRKRIEETEISIDNKKKISITCSFGISEFKAQDSSLEEVVKRADKALYDAKNTKRNSVFLWSI